MRNNNQTVIRKITMRTLTADKRRNFFVIAAIALTTFMIASVYSIGVSFIDSINMSEKRMQGSTSNMAFGSPTKEQLEKIYTLDYIKTVGIGAVIAQTKDIPRLDEVEISYVDKVQWEKMFCPTFTNITGNYPEKENEISVSRYILEAMGIDDPVIGMEIPISFSVNDSEKVSTEFFTIACIYTEYVHSRPNGYTAIFTSFALADKYGKTTPDNCTVNVIFKDERNVGESIEKLKQDLAFSQEQKYIQSPAFNDSKLDLQSYIAIITITIFFMFTGYLLIYNVMYISVSKNVRFYGMLKTLGTTPKQLSRIVIGQTICLCIIGLPVGCLASAAVSLVIVPAVILNSGIDTGAVVSFSPVIYAGAMLFSILTALLGAVPSAKKAADISPIEAMKFTGVQNVKSSIYSEANGKPYKMALRNIFRDRKRAVIVILSLFLGIVIFSTIMTVIKSMDIDYRVNSEYDYDFSLTSTNMSQYPDWSIDNKFADEIKALEGITEYGAVTLGPAEFVYTQNLNRYVDWLSTEHSISKDEIINNHLNIGVKGIDLLELKKINEKLSKPVDMEAFERGETALINMWNENDKDMLECLTDADSFLIKIGSESEPFQVTNSGIVRHRHAPFSLYRCFSGPEILVSNTFLRKNNSAPPTIIMDINVEKNYTEQIFNTLSEIENQNNIEVISRYAARKAMEDARTIMLVLGGGISLTLGVIGIFNFINVISTGIMVRRHELATLESVGMSKKQMRSMLRYEGVGYALITIFSAATLGNIIVYITFQLYKNIADYAHFTYPLTSVALISVIIAIICFITPELVYKNISSLTLADRLRESE